MEQASTTAEGNRPRMTWHPIATAPRDGSEILVCGGTFTDDDDWTGGIYPFTGCAIVQWEGDYDSGAHPWGGAPRHAHDAYRRHDPTHWTDLPPPPEGEGA